MTPPVVLVNNIRAGITRVLFMTRRSPGFRKEVMDEKRDSLIKPFCQTSNLEEDLSAAGYAGMRSSGRIKSKSSVLISGMGMRQRKDRMFLWRKFPC
jgi:hypothetical protein